MFDQCLYFNTAALARRLEREWTDAFAPFGLTPPQAFMLRAVLAVPGQVQRQLADALGIARPTTTRALDGLAARGLIERRSSGNDGRESAIFPTAAAQTLGPELDAASGQVTRRLKTLLGEAVFGDTVKRIRGARAVLA